MSETEINNIEISDKASAIKDLFGGEKNFNKTRFKEDAERAQAEGRSLDSLNIEDYRLKDDNDNGSENNSSNDFSNGSNLHFKAGYENGMYVARGPGGKVITGKTQDEMHTQLAQEFVKDAQKTGDVPYCRHTGPKDDKEGMKSFAKTFINAGVAIDGDVPNDPQFWQQFKQEYMKNPENKIENWNMLTSKIPPEYMGEKSKQQSNSLSSHIKSLRNGINRNLTPEMPRAVQRTTVNQMDLAKFKQSTISMG